ncbi:MAG: uracil-DNA glycosylase [Alphaproteobacteria bacterium]|nr:uracil-DNA glycosylase [Alphaproteobacteria bacterium]
MGNTQRKSVKSALEWYVDHGVDEVLGDEPVDRTAMPSFAPAPAKAQSPKAPPSAVPVGASEQPAFLGKSDARAESLKLAQEADTLEALQEAIAGFDGLSVKRTATNMVFCDGNPKARVMLIGEAPGADEDRQGKPFVGVSGQLLDRILKCIDLDRTETDVDKAIYISNILNWRPPGNRTPNAAEIAVSLPFIEKHITLIKPDLLILCGGVSAKALLGKEDSVSRLRKGWHDYCLQTVELGYEGPSIPAIVTYHPAYLLRTPVQKKAVWSDMLKLQQKRNELDRK